MEDKRRKLTDEQRIEIHRRWYNRLRSGELVKDIAEHFEIAPTYVRDVVRAVDAAGRGKRK